MPMGLLVVLLLATSTPISARDTAPTTADALREAQARTVVADLAGAERLYRDLLRRDPMNYEARLGLAEVRIAQGQPDDALAALAMVPPNAASNGVRQRLRAEAFLLLNRSHAARAACEVGLRINPLNAKLIEVRAQTAYRLGSMPLASALYGRAARMDPTLESANMRLGSGFGPPTSNVPWRVQPERAAFEAAVAAWRAGSLDLAHERFAALVARRPTCAKYRLGVGQCLRELRLRHNVGQNDPARFRTLPNPKVPGIERLIPQWAALSQESQHVVAWSTAPGARWLPALAEAKCRHDILSWDDVLTEASERSRYKTTFDGRRWRQMRGIGGQIAATGVEKLRLAAAFSFNTYAHEYAHQLLSYGFSKRLRAQVQSLYHDARATGRCLDYYAASNVDEYFAQGYEAFVSLHKNRRLRVTAKHTRAELARRDPALFAFLKDILDRSHESASALSAFHNYGKR